jgi:hypothetical protein
MLSVHLCDEEFLIADESRIVARMPTMMLKQEGLDSFLQLNCRDVTPGEYQEFLLGIVTAIRLLEPGALVQPAWMPEPSPELASGGHPSEADALKEPWP